MARLFGVILDDNKRIEYELTHIYGIGWSRSKEILKRLNIDTHKKVKDFTEEELKKLTNAVDKNLKVEGNLREDIVDNIKRLREIGSYKGTRHLKGLPARGQRTRSNARTKRGKRRTVGAFKKEAWAKLEQGNVKSKKS